MSTFLTTDDYNPLIRDTTLAKVILNDETILDEAEEMAIEEMKSYLAARFDTDAIFSAAGDDRNKAILMRLIDITIYHLWSRTIATQISKIRVDRYERAIKWLEMCARGELTPDLPIKEDDEGNPENRIRYGSNPKNKHIW